jgi:hypothetical protein
LVLRTNILVEQNLKIFLLINMFDYIFPGQCFFLQKLLLEKYYKIQNWKKYKCRKNIQKYRPPPKYIQKH